MATSALVGVAKQRSLTDILHTPEVSQLIKPSSWGRVPEFYQYRKKINPISGTSPSLGQEIEFPIGRYGPFVTEPVLELDVTMPTSTAEPMLGAGFLLISHFRWEWDGVEKFRVPGWVAYWDYLFNTPLKQRMTLDTQVGNRHIDLAMNFGDDVSNLVATKASPLRLHHHADYGLPTAATTAGALKHTYRVPLPGFFQDNLVPIMLLSDNRLRLVVQLANARDWIAPSAVTIGGGTTVLTTGVALANVGLEMTYVLVDEAVQAKVRDAYKNSNYSWSWLTLAFGYEQKNLTITTGTTERIPINGLRHRNVAYILFNITKNVAALGTGAVDKDVTSFMNILTGTDTVTASGSGSGTGDVTSRHSVSGTFNLASWSFYGSGERITGKSRDSNWAEWLNETVPRRFAGHPTNYLPFVSKNIMADISDPVASEAAEGPQVIAGEVWCADALASKHHCTNDYDFNQISDPELDITLHAAASDSLTNSFTIDANRLNIMWAYHTLTQINNFQLDVLM